MKIDFYMKTDTDVVTYQTDGKLNKNILEFHENQSTTLMSILILEKELLIKRRGHIQMELSCVLGKTTEGLFIDEYNLKMDLKIYTKQLTVKKGQLFLIYDLFIEEEYISEHEMLINYKI